MNREIKFRVVGNIYELDKYEKNCKSCCSTFSKKPYCSVKVWETRMYCSVKCSKAKYKSKDIACSYCHVNIYVKRSVAKKYKRHFCSRACYSAFRKDLLAMHEQNAYKGVRKPGESTHVYHRRYCKSNPEIISHLKARRYARERAAEGSHTLQEWNALKQQFNNRCAYCTEAKKLTKDHIIPLSKGGSDYISNIQPLCGNCNSKKCNNIYEHPELLKSK